MTCQDDAALTGPVSLFLGIETATWTVQQFQDTARWARSRGISTLFIKCAEVGSPAGGTSGWWYGGQSGFDAIYLAVSPIINVIPYMFPYGNTYGALTQEVAIAKALMQAYGKLCLDMEQSYWVGANGALWAKSFADVLAPMPGKLWLSHPANPVESNQLPFMAAMSPAVNIFMPMVYNDYLATKWQGDLAQINPQACIQPTLDLSQEFGANNVLGIAQKTRAAGILAVSLWYEGYGRTNPVLVDQIVTLFGGTPVVAPPIGGSVKLDSNGCVVTTRLWYQLSEGEEDTCGPTAAAAIDNSVFPGTPLTATPEDIDQETDDIIQNVFGISDPKNFLGVTPQDMYNLLIYIRDKYKRIHFQVVSSIDQIDRAVLSGFPCIVSCNEMTEYAWNKSKQQWEHPYPWQLAAGHVFPVTGIEAGTGNWICPDQLNNNFQGYWPPIYRRSDIAASFSWGAIIQLTKFLAPIPDLANWPANFNAQIPAAPVPPPVPAPVPPLVTNQQKQFQDIWNASAFLFPGGVAPSYTSGIANEWKTTYMPRFFLGPPVSPEFHTVDWTGKDIIVQLFLNGVCQYTFGQGGRWWLGNMEITTK